MADDNGAAGAAGAGAENEAAGAAAGAAGGQQAGQQQTATILGGEGGGGAAQGGAEGSNVPADWPADWRAKVAGEDAKELARLQRMGSPADLYKAYRALEAKLSSGQVKTALPENPTEEDLAAWRKENGLPEKPDGYVPALGKGLVLGEQDQPLVDGFKQTAFEAGMTPAQFNKALNWYYTEIDRFQKTQEEGDTVFHAQTEDSLRQEWGGEYRGNINAVENLLQLAPEGVADALLAGRTADGKKIGDHPGIIKWLAAMAREMNPAMPHIPVGSGDPVKATGDRIAEIEKMMRTDAASYWKDERVQQEYRDLLAAKERLSGRSAA